MVVGIALAAASLSSLPAMAQDSAARVDDRAYCNALARTYERYMPTRSYGGSIGASPATETSVAMENCNNGRAAEAIPVLEKVLRANGFRTPERAIARQPQ
jgi:hypothetical protein